MIRELSGENESGSTRRNIAALTAVDRLALAASPTFASMALLTLVLGGGNAETPCAAHGSVLTGMVTMYLLMSAFHGGAWIKQIRTAARRSG
jgi:hypothetical protein